MIVKEIRTLNVLPLPSWGIRKATKDTWYNFRNASTVAAECLNRSWMLGAVVFLIVMSIALGYSELARKECKDEVRKFGEYIESLDDD